MKLKVLIGYNDKELDRYVSLGEIIEVTEERANVPEKVKDYLGRNIVERIKEEDEYKEPKGQAQEDEVPDINPDEESQDSEKENKEAENPELENQEEANENLNEQKQEINEQKNSQKNNEKIDQKNGKIEAKNEEGVP